jgi:hypothetical protein
MREVGRHHYDQWLELGSSGRLKVEEDKAKELHTRKQEQGCMNLPVRFPPHLSTHTTYEKMSCATLGVRTPHSIYPATNKGGPGPASELAWGNQSVTRGGEAICRHYAQCKKVSSVQEPWQ